MKRSVFLLLAILLLFAGCGLVKKSVPPPSDPAEEKVRPPWNVIEPTASPPDGAEEPEAPKFDVEAFVEDVLFYAEGDRIMQIVASNRIFSVYVRDALPIKEALQVETWTALPKDGVADGPIEPQIILRNQPYAEIVIDVGDGYVFVTQYDMAAPEIEDKVRKYAYIIEASAVAEVRKLAESLEESAISFVN